jgi:glutaredoxin-related protein
LLYQSYCPYSRHVRRIFEEYSISPAPTYIQIDQRVDGPIIHSLLQEFTARETIPSVLLNWQPIGGADEIELAAAEGSLSRIFEKEGLSVTSKYV